METLWQHWFSLQRLILHHTTPRSSQLWNKLAKLWRDCPMYNGPNAINLETVHTCSMMRLLKIWASTIITMAIDGHIVVRKLITDSILLILTHFQKYCCWRYFNAFNSECNTNDSYKILFIFHYNEARQGQCEHGACNNQ